MAAEYTAAQLGSLNCQQRYPYGSLPPHSSLYLKKRNGDWMRYCATGGSISTGLVASTNTVLVDLLEQQNALSNHAGIVWGEPEGAQCQSLSSNS